MLPVVVEAPRENNIGGKLVSATKKIETWKAMLSAIMSRLASCCANSSEAEIQADTCMTALRSIISILEERINALTSRAEEITNLMFGSEMS